MSRSLHDHHDPYVVPPEGVTTSCHSLSSIGRYLGHGGRNGSSNRIMLSNACSTDLKA